MEAASWLVNGEAVPRGPAIGVATAAAAADAVAGSNDGSCWRIRACRL